MAPKKARFLKNLISLVLDIFGIALIMGSVTLDLYQNDTGLYEIGNLQIAIIFVGITIAVIGNFTLQSPSLLTAVKSFKSVSFVVFMASLLLLMINSIGLGISLRNPNVYNGLEYAGKIRTPKYSAKEIYAQMDRDASIDEQYSEYVKRLTKLIFDGSVHYWEENEENNAYNLRVPIHENYLIYFSNLLTGNQQNHEFCRAERAIERSACVCSQSSKILADILGRNRVPTHIVGLEGHVVARARVDKEMDEWWLLDADYGVVIEHDIDDVESNLGYIQEAYEEQGYRQNFIDVLIDIYGPEGNSIIDENHECGEEDHLYLLKWLIPAMGILPFVAFMFIYQIRRQK
ncbi:MAG: hypothetical protein ISR58_01725 [Anaerolineales bacterium]|nr:hypothetical protein [Chloroflexota bacterium]MBL6979885.1 hypothetical protein [Anaerolineales bacterium]